MKAFLFISFFFQTFFFFSFFVQPFLFISQLTYKPAIVTTFIFSIFLFISSIVYVRYYRKRKTSSVKRLPPGPKPWPFLGCLPAMLSKKNTSTHQWIHAIMKQFNTEIACIRLGLNTHIIPVTSPELALEFLKTHDSVVGSRPLSMTAELLSHGYLGAVLSPIGDQWKKMKRILVSQVLNPSTLNRMIGQRTNEADTLLRYILSLGRNGEAVNIRSIARHYCGNVIRRMVFNRRYYGKGREDGGPSFEEENHNQALFTILMHLNAFSISDFMPCLRPFDLNGHEKIVKRALKVIRDLDEPIINKRVQEWRDGKKKEVEDILDILISLKNENGKSLLSTEEIKAQITELQLATIDNPSNAVEWAMVELLNQPKLLQKAVEELDQVVGKNRLVQESDIPNLKYLIACIRESFRLHPISPFNVPHVSIVDVVVAGYFIPKGSQVLLSRSGLGLNPRIWEDPMKFDPERHLKDETTIESGISEPNLRFITFTRGRRGCIGSSLGTNITMMLIARLLQGFSWNLLPGITKIDFSKIDELSLSMPLHLHVKPRLSHLMYPSK